jgi:hypothetical protein
MIPSFLATDIRLTAGLSEFTLLFNTWIISSPADNDHQHYYTWLLPSALGAIIFAISEPLYTFILVRLPIEPAFLALVVPVSQVLTTMLLWDVTGAVELERIRATNKYIQRAETSKEARYEAPSVRDSLGFDSVTLKRAQELGHNTFWAFVVAHVQHAASTTASLLFFAQNIDVTHTKSSALHIFLVSSAVVYFGLSRLADYVFARFAELPCYIGENGLGEPVKQVKNLLWLIVVRAVVRVALGMNAVSGPFSADGAGAEYFFAEASLLNALKGIPGWVWCAVFALNLCLWGLGGFLEGRAEANVRAERLD